MIKLDLPEKPAQLTDELISQLTEKFKADGTSVWKKKFIEEAVFNIAFGKCCYSESKLQEEGKYMEIDHFYSKNIFKDKVVEWGNLLPSNQKCNKTKGAHNVETNPIVNPFTDNPKDHFYISNGTFFPKTDVGKTTIKVVALNDVRHFVEKRYRIGMEVTEVIRQLHDEIIEEYNAILLFESKKVRFLHKVKGVLQQGNRRYPYSANIATAILTDPNFDVIEQFLLDNNLWNSELATLKAELEFCSLPK